MYIHIPGKVCHEIVKLIVKDNLFLIINRKYIQNELFHFLCPLVVIFKGRMCMYTSILSAIFTSYEAQRDGTSSSGPVVRSVLHYIVSVYLAIKVQM